MSFSPPTTGDSKYRWYCRFTALVFSLVSAYTVMIKVPAGDFTRDWAHTALHVATALLAVHLGWFAPVGWGQRRFTWVLVAAYGALGAVGWAVGGILMDSPFRVPLTAADNVFHLLLAAVGVAVALRVERTFAPAI